MKSPTLINYIVLCLMVANMFDIVIADLPVHCLKSEIAGKWEFELTKPNSEYNYYKNKCGHQVPDNEKTSYSSFQEEFVVHEKVQALLKKSSEAETLNDKGEFISQKKGNWTMVYDEGFEVHFGNLHFFTFSEYYPDKDQSSKYISNCGKTLVGWYHDYEKDTYGCIRGRKLNVKGKELEKENKLEKIKVLDKEIVNARFLQRKGNKILQQVALKMQEEIGNGERSRFKAKERAEGGVEKLLLSKEFRDHDKILQRIKELPKSWTADLHEEFNNSTLHDLNKFAARSKSIFGFKENQKQRKKPKGEDKKEDDLSDLPKELSWKDHLPPITAQGGCGSCYAIATLAMISARLSIHQKIKVSLSVQHAIDCNYYNQGCDGGYPGLVAKFGTESFFVDSKCKKYTATNGKCEKVCENDSEVVYRVQDYWYVGGSYGKSSERFMMEEIMKNGPIVVSFEPSYLFMMYKKGIYHEIEAKNWIAKGEKKPEWEKVDHSVLCYGWGEENGQKFWLLMNSWGNDWGESGLFRVKRGNDEMGIESIAEAAMPYSVTIDMNSEGFGIK